ncbi:MAG: glycosyltransferase family 2 protein [Candidatus Melainabacteria bacterium]
MPAGSTDTAYTTTHGKPSRTVSWVVPVYNEVLLLPELINRIHSVIRKLPRYRWEVILVNDGSRDGSDLALTTLADQTPWLTVLHLSRNFGHQIAISAGIDYARGDAVIVMDGDLQDPPELIIEMLAQWERGYEVVYATRKHRQGETPFKLATAKVFYRLLNKLADIPIPLDTGDFRLMGRPVVNALVHMRERNRFIRGLVSWVGFPQTAVYYHRDERTQGETKYTLFKMLRFALDGILSFSKVPLQMITSLGFMISAFAFLASVVIIGLKLFTHLPVITGWSSVMITVLMLGGIQLICLGMIGEYVARIFDEARGRPLYLIQRVDTRQSVDDDRPPVLPSDFRSVDLPVLSLPAAPRE